jgi:Cd2+/Zn2+-exporting ATPase/Cu+-exporting ATPase
VQKAIARIPGVKSVDVFLVTEKAVVTLDSKQVDLPVIRDAVEGAGYKVEEPQVSPSDSRLQQNFTRPVWIILGAVFGAVLFVVVVGEWLGLFETLTERVPWYVWLAVVLVGGYPVFRNVLRATLKGQIIAHTLMTLGVVAAIAVGEWATAAVVVFFMRVGDYVEKFTTERARSAVKNLTALAPQMARVERDDEELEIPVDQVAVGEIVVVRPGEKIPVDGSVVSGQATVNQATITGESMPVEAGPGFRVFAATFVQLGSIRVSSTHIGPDTTFGHVIKMVEEAEAQRADVQRVADKFSAYFLPIVVGIAVLTLLIRRDPMATAAVLVVACSCAFALATPIAMLASIGAGAKSGIMIKGGKYLEILAEADVLLIDKTGTLTLGKPEIKDFRLLIDDYTKSSDHQSTFANPHSEILCLAASAERYSEHPLAEALRDAARKQNLSLQAPEEFISFPGLGVRALVAGRKVEVGNRRMFNEGFGQFENLSDMVDELEAQGKTSIFVALDDRLVALLTAADTMRPEVPQAMDAVCELGIHEVELLTGDNERTAKALAEQIQTAMDTNLEIRYRADLLPEDKIRIVKSYQEQNRKIIMIGDGVNDAPALAQSDIGIAMGVAGSDVAIQAAHIALMRDDWNLVPEVIRIARRTMRVVKMNIAFTAVYNLLGLSLAALGILPPILAAAAQSLPDLGILANSSRLLRQK